MKILVVGTGAREHAIVRALSLDPQVSALHAAPGNPGIAALATVHAVDQLDGDAVAALATELGVDLVVVGPEAPLVAGVADPVRAAGIPVFGPSRAAAQLEGSKAFAKDVMAAAGVPTAEPRLVTAPDEVEAALDAFGAPYVVKEDGLAAGKGVVVTTDRAEALEHALACLAKDGGRVVVEEYLDGPEVSVFVVSDGVDVVPFVAAQDFKRVGDHGTGPNTGGMGAYTPIPASPGLVDEVIDAVARPTIEEMARRGTPFVGVLYCGLALTRRGMRVVEFNARFGDPEIQAVLPLLTTPLAGVLLAAATGRLGELAPLEWSDDAAVNVVVASAGYPEGPRSGDVIGGIDAAEDLPGVHVLHAGTALDGDGRLVTAGGRVLSVVGRGADLAAARAAAYAGVERIAFDGAHHRTDIAEAAARGEWHTEGGLA
ncbi:phosphoribosylamine--glycine ligase [Cellulomonas alba]|uniref:Phosphoribosylamine--glycine ligase n=1 Tax=Cellulomonas alba TaxID=3053467 RepID=A0ABT7SGF2_9CELL|nr:phosphoribosylamine--glycine ligase [Cellulomonas alba]MDM7854627.1 phosphoribosylamine--glycine ligase [Cellulomonas alba]